MPARPACCNTVFLVASDIRQRSISYDHRLGRYRDAFLFRGFQGERHDRHRPDPGASKVYDRTAKDWIKPEGGSNHAPYLGVTAWLFGVPVTSENKEAAWDLAAFFCNPEASTKLVAFPDSGIQPSRAKTIQDPQPLIDAGMDPADAKQYLGAIGKAVGHPNAVLDLSIPGSGEYYNSLDVEASRFMAGEVSAEQAMKNASDAWNQTTDRLGRENQSKLYKAALAG
jgi:multiple sugar transport system substrate-binding protein